MPNKEESVNCKDGKKLPDTLFSKRNVPLIHPFFLVTLTQGHQEKLMNFKKVRFFLRRVYLVV